MPSHQQLVIISGPPGVGKTTVSETLRSLKPGSVCIHGDDLRRFAPQDARTHLGGGSTFRAGAALARAYLQMGASRVIFDYCFLNSGHIAHFEESLLVAVQPQMFTLWASLRTVKVREQDRVGREPLGNAVNECHHEIATNLAILGRTLDAESTAPAILAAKIDSLLVATSNAAMPTMRHL